MKVIFLDIDGVLNNWESMPIARSKGYDGSGINGWDERCTRELKRIVEETGARIVISSLWRLDISNRRSEYAISCGFTMYGIPDYLDVTPVFQGELRGTEIKAWLDETIEQVESYVIIDDDSDMLPEQMTYFVQTSLFAGGLTKELADKAIGILNGT